MALVSKGLRRAPASEDCTVSPNNSPASENHRSGSLRRTLLALASAAGQQIALLMSVAAS